MTVLAAVAGGCAGCVAEPATGQLVVRWHFADGLDCGGAGVDMIHVESRRGRFEESIVSCTQGTDGVDVGPVRVGFARVDVTGRTRSGGESYGGVAAVDVDGGEEHRVDVGLLPR